MAALLKSPEPRRKGIFPGYSLLVAGGLMVLWGVSIHTYAFGQFIKPLQEAFGWTRAQISVAASLARLEGGLEGPFGGLAVDKWGPRVVNLCGFILFGLGLIAMYFVNSLWVFYVVWLVASTGYNMGTTGPIDAAMANWFVKKRGLMIAIMRIFNASSALVIALVTWLLYAFGWRLAFVYLGIGTLLIGIPLTWFFIKPRRPEYYGWLPDGKRASEETAEDTEAIQAIIKAGVKYATEATGEVEFTVRQAMRDRIFWICTVVASSRGMLSSVINLHTIPLLTDLGMNPMAAAGAMGTMVFMYIPGRLLFGWLGDRITLKQLKYVVIGAMLVMALGIFILTKATNMAWVWVAIMVWGMGSGADLAIWPVLRGRYWGRKAYATIQGAMSPFGMVAGIIAPVYAGWAYDTTGSYMGAFNVLLIGFLVTASVMFFGNPPKRPERIGKISEVV